MSEVAEKWTAQRLLRKPSQSVCFELSAQQALRGPVSSK